MSWDIRLILHLPEKYTQDGDSFFLTSLIKPTCTIWIWVFSGGGEGGVFYFFVCLFWVFLQHKGVSFI